MIIDTIVQNVDLASIDLNSLSVVLSDKYILVFNATQTPYPIFNKYITDMFWPQTKFYGDSTIWQTSSPIIASINENWSLSESNMSFEVIPFTNCQGIPVKVTSVQSSDLVSSAFIINNNKIIIDSGYEYQNGFRDLDTLNPKTKGKNNNYINLVGTNQTLVIFVEGITDTTIPTTANNTINIFIQNYTPIISNLPDVIKIKISEGYNLSVTNLNYCSSNSSSITVSDDEGDSIYLTIDSDIPGFVQNQILLDNQNCEFSLYIDTTNFIPGSYSMVFNIWDIFHKNDPLETKIKIHMSYFVPPIFESILPTSLTVQIWCQNVFELPKIYDEDGDYSNIIVTPRK